MFEQGFTVHVVIEIHEFIEVPLASYFDYPVRNSLGQSVVMGGEENSAFIFF